MTLITLQKLNINVKATNFNSRMLTPRRGGGGGGMQGRGWLRHFTTSQKVVGSIPDGVIGIFH